MINSYYTILKMSIFLNKEVSGKKLIQIIFDSNHRIYLFFEHGAIIANIEPGQNYIYWQGNLKHKPVPHFSRFNELRDINVKNLFIENNERIINIFFENGKILKLFLFPPYNNAILLSSKNEIIECYYEKKLEKFADIYSSKYSGVRSTLLNTYFQDTQSITLKKILEENYPALTQKKLVGEIENRLEINNVEVEIKNLSLKQKNNLQKLIEELNSSVTVLLKKEKPYLKFTEFLPYIPSIISITSSIKKDEVIEYFDDINRAAQVFINTTRKVLEFEKLWQNISLTLKSKFKYYQNTLKKLNSQLRQADKREKYVQQANLILWNLHDIKKGDKEKELTDYNSPDLIKTKVKLDFRMEPKEYAEYLFKKAKKLEDLGRVKKRVKNTEKSLALYSQLNMELSSIVEIKTIKAFINKIKNLGIEVDEKQKSKNIFKKRKIFRQFIYKNYLIRVGKSAHESDELTFKISNKWDWFFHAQGVTGSHVIISHVEGKKLEFLPPVILNIGGIVAAYYSEAKNSSYVPVQYTQIRYLRKSKGAPAGLVIFNRYKSVFVEPQKFQKLDFE